VREDKKVIGVLDDSEFKFIKPPQKEKSFNNKNDEDQQSQ